MIDVAHPPQPAQSDLEAHVEEAKRRLAAAEAELEFAQKAAVDDTPWIALSMRSPLIGPARITIASFLAPIAKDLARYGYVLTFQLTPLDTPEGTE